MSKSSPKAKKTTSSIGTKKESSLHQSLKFRYSDTTEVMIGNYVCDGQTGKGEIIEVQTGSFGPLKKKVKALAKTGKVRIIHPIIAQKHIELYDKEGNLLHRRKSPRKGNLWDLFGALVHAPELCFHKNLTIELAVVDISEKRVNDGKGSWRRKGVRITDRHLGAWHHSVVLKSRKDYYQFIPFKKSESFTVRDFREKAGLNASLAGKAIYVLAKIGIIEQTGKQGRAFVYKRR
ncbi:MAG: hypothetical protein LBH42_09115 [Treponema sp.]|jgi:hypothetical protein|nr:hypothetical protein [Treponema sp.]